MTSTRRHVAPKRVRPCGSHQRQLTQDLNSDYPLSHSAMPFHPRTTLQSHDSTQRDRIQREQGATRSSCFLRTLHLTPDEIYPALIAIAKREFEDGENYVGTHGAKIRSIADRSLGWNTEPSRVVPLEYVGEESTEIFFCLSSRSEGSVRPNFSRGSRRVLLTSKELVLCSIAMKNLLVCVPTPLGRKPHPGFDVVWCDPLAQFAKNIGNSEVDTLPIEPKESCEEE